MYKIVLACSGVPSSAGTEAATDITAEFAQHRHWHKKVKCQWAGSRLILEAENDYDSKGLALQDEFSDCIAAYIREPFNGSITVESILESSAELAQPTVPVDVHASASLRRGRG